MLFSDWRNPNPSFHSTSSFQSVPSQSTASTHPLLPQTLLLSSLPFTGPSSSPLLHSATSFGLHLACISLSFHFPFRPPPLPSFFKFALNFSAFQFHFHFQFSLSANTLPMFPRFYRWRRKL
ncbi:hypothetical protein ACSQ67_009789 [Phaseolus vulgaris]